MHSLLTCLRCLKGLESSKTTPQHVAEDVISSDDIEIQFSNYNFEVPLETERNSSFMNGSIDENDVISFGASSIHLISERCSSISDMFELRNSKGISPNPINSHSRNSNTCLVLKPPQSFFSFVNKIN